MSNLEERLKAISKVDVTETAVHNAKERILSKSKKKRFELAPIIVTGFMFALMCMLIFMPTSKTADRAASLFTDDIKEIHFLENDRPNLNHRADSFNYVLVKEILNQPKQLEDFKIVLKEAQNNVQPWAGKIDEPSIYELAVVMGSGEVYHLKYNGYDGSEDAIVVYDVKNKLKYVAPHNEETIAFYEHLYKENYAFDLEFWVILCWIAGIAIIIFIASHFYRKKYAILDERGKPKRLKGWAHYIPYFLFIVPLFTMTIIVGTLHIGLFLILIFLHSLITSQLEMKMGIVRPNNIHFKFLLPFYTLCVIIALTLILVV
jgi:hypothetical protein